MERQAEARRICHNKEKGDAKIHKSIDQDDGWSKNLLSCSCLYRLLFLFLHLIYKKGLMGLWLKRKGPYGLKTKKKRVLWDLRLKIKKRVLLAKG